MQRSPAIGEFANATSPPPAPTQLLLNAVYQKNQHVGVNGRLGFGASSEVSLYHNVKTHKRFAIKKIMKTLAITNSAMFSKVEEETVIHRFLDHPNICTLFDYFEDNSAIYIVLDYAKGGDLRKCIDSVF
jgi:serine/threonine protein kinase